MAYLTRRTLLLAKKETTYGVDAVPDPSLDAICISDLSITPNVDTVERNCYRDTLSAQADLPAKMYTELSFTLELKGNGLEHDGQTEPRALRLFEACGYDVIAYPESSAGAGDGYFELKPKSTNFASLTFYVYIDNLLYKVYGARGNVRINVEANQIGKAEFTFNGLFVKPVDSTLPTATYEAPDLAPPLAQAVGFTMGSGGFAPIISQFEFDMGNELVQRDDMNSDAGVGSVDIIGRKVSGSLNPDIMSASEYDVWTAFLNHTPEPLSGTLGSQAGNKIEIEIPKAVYTSIGIGDRDSVRIYDINFAAVGHDDEVVIRFR